MNENQDKLVTKLVLLNAVKHNGKANPGAVVGGLLGEFPELKSQMKEVMQSINKKVQEINSLSLDKQKKELLSIDSSALDKKEHIVDLFGFFNIKEGEEVITAFPPGPEKYPHIGHAKAILLNYELAKKYNGKFILRFEDTNPDLVKEEFYEIMQEDFKWLGVTWDKLVYASDYMDLYYKKCLEVLKSNNAYVCNCQGEQIKHGRETGEACECRNLSVEQNISLWNEMQSAKQGSYIVRLKIDLKHKNSTMRDPAIFRINDTIHARQKDKYRIWPNYDFQNAIMDGEFKINYRLRGKEFEMRNELQRYIQDLLKYPITTTYEFGRFNLEGVLASGRVIREKVLSKELIGWDDPTLTTLRALKRRGFLPEAIKSFVISTGITKNDATLTWNDFIMHNKRLLDEEANRYFFVENPVEIKVDGGPAKEFELNLNPINKKGGRKFKSDELFFIAKKDFFSLDEGSIYRFMECFNVKYLAGSSFEYVNDDIDFYKKNGKGMLHYLPKHMDLIDVSIMMPDKKILKGIAEPSVESIKVGDIVQFERFGFCRLDNKEKMLFWFTH